MGHSLLVLFAIFVIFECASSFNITHNNMSLHAHRRRMVDPLTALGTIASIATIISGAIDASQTANALLKDINSRGAAIGIDNYFEYVALRQVGLKVMDGAENDGNSETDIQRKQTGANGGVFSDDSFTFGDGSAGIVRYKAIDPVISSRVYCFDYFWSCQSYQVSYHTDRNYGNPYSYTQLPGGIAIVISSDRCNRDITQSFKDIARFWTQKVDSSGINDWDYQYSGYWSSNDNGGYGKDAMIAITNREKQKEIRIGSDDLMVAMKAKMSNSDKTAIDITIGPYKKVYYGNIHNHDTWYPFQNDHECIGGTETYLGTFTNVRDCFEKCQQTQNAKGKDCNYLVFGKRSKFGTCYWESSCRSFIDNEYTVISVGGPEYELYEPRIDCSSGTEQKLGNFNTVDECAAACISQKGNKCEFFAFGINNKIGSCWWEESCTDEESDDNYNVYVIKHNSNIQFGSNSVWKRKSMDVAVTRFGSKQIDMLWDVEKDGLLTSAVIGSAIGCSIVFTMICCCRRVGNEMKK